MFRIRYTAFPTLDLLTDIAFVSTSNQVASFWCHSVCLSVSSCTHQPSIRTQNLDSYTTINHYDYIIIAIDQRTSHMIANELLGSEPAVISNIGQHFGIYRAAIHGAGHKRVRLAEDHAGAPHERVQTLLRHEQQDSRLAWRDACG